MGLVYSQIRRQEVGYVARTLMAPREEPVKTSPNAVRQIAQAAPALCACMKQHVQSGPHMPH